jgi:hypothetical protein
MLKLPDNFVFPKKIKIDIGMSNCPMYARDWLDQEPDVFVFGFEPNPNAIKQMKENNSFGPHWNRVHIFPVALGDVTEPSEMSFYITSVELSSSLYKPTKSFLEHYNFQITDIITVPVYPLSAFFAIAPPDVFIEYIKIDAQGADLDIVKSASYDIQQKVAYITLEGDGNFYEDCDDTVENIYSFMTHLGFIKINHPNTMDPTYQNPKFAHLNIYICQKPRNT